MPPRWSRTRRRASVSHLVTPPMYHTRSAKRPPQRYLVTTSTKLAPSANRLAPLLPGYHPSQARSIVTSLSPLHTYPTQACSICQEACEQGQRWDVTPCNHAFHEDCLRRWATHRALALTLTCPNPLTSPIPRPNPNPDPDSDPHPHPHLPLTPPWPPTLTRWLTHCAKEAAEASVPTPAAACPDCRRPLSSSRFRLFGTSTRR
jgi:hypothetical protein